MATIILSVCIISAFNETNAGNINIFNLFIKICPRRTLIKIHSRNLFSIKMFFTCRKFNSYGPKERSVPPTACYFHLYSEQAEGCWDFTTYYVCIPKSDHYKFYLKR